MESCQVAELQPVSRGYKDTTRMLLDGLILYRIELGETGRQLERLLRQYGVVASNDLPCSKQVH